MASAKAGDGKVGSLRVRYETTEVKYGSQFVVNATQEDITVNCSAGYINDPNTKENLLPIHTRLVLTPTGAQRLVETLQQAIANAGVEPNRDVSAKPSGGTEAALPKIN